jgi:hypothetical protein
VTVLSEQAATRGRASRSQATRGVGPANEDCNEVGKRDGGIGKLDVLGGDVGSVVRVVGVRVWIMLFRALPSREGKSRGSMRSKSGAAQAPRATFPRTALAYLVPVALL